MYRRWTGDRFGGRIMSYMNQGAYMVLDQGAWQNTSVIAVDWGALRAVKGFLLKVF